MIFASTNGKVGEELLGLAKLIINIKTVKYRKAMIHCEIKTSTESIYKVVELFRLTVACLRINTSSQYLDRGLDKNGILFNTVLINYFFDFALKVFKGSDFLPFPRPFALLAALAFLILFSVVLCIPTNPTSPPVIPFLPSFGRR